MLRATGLMIISGDQLRLGAICISVCVPSFLLGITSLVAFALLNFK